MFPGGLFALLRLNKSGKWVKKLLGHECPTKTGFVRVVRALCVRCAQKKQVKVKQGGICRVSGAITVILVRGLCAQPRTNAQV